MHDRIDRIVHASLQILEPESPWTLHRRGRLLSLERLCQYGSRHSCPLPSIPHGLAIAGIPPTKAHFDGNIFSRKLVSSSLDLGGVLVC